MYLLSLKSWPHDWNDEHLVWHKSRYPVLVPRQRTLRRRRRFTVLYNKKRKWCTLTRNSWIMWLNLDGIHFGVNTNAKMGICLGCNADQDPGSACIGTDPDLDADPSPDPGCKKLFESQTNILLLSELGQKEDFFAVFTVFDSSKYR